MIGSELSAIFDDKANSLTIFDQQVYVNDGVPELNDQGSKAVVLPVGEPLQRECQHFLECVKTRATPLTDGASGAAVVRVLEVGQRSIEQGGKEIRFDEY